MKSPRKPCNERTQRCLKELKQSTTKSKAILTVGLRESGKTSLIKLAAGETAIVESEEDSITTTCQVVDVPIGDTKYYLIDTPGFEAGSEWETFLEIANMIEQIRNHVSFLGIWFVVDNRNRVRDSEKILYRWLSALCGDAYFPQLAFVTTFWDGHTRSIQAHNSRFQNREKNEWIRFPEAATYQFGKRYVNGEATENIIPWYDGRDELVAHARDLLARQVSHTPSVEPRIVRELAQGLSVEHTEAARVLRPGGTGSTAQGPNPATAPEQPAVNQDAASTPASEAAGRSWPTAIIDGFFYVIGKFAENVQIDIGGGGNGGGIGGGFREPGRAFQGNPSSVVDQFKARGMDSSFANREQVYFAQGGRGRYIGSRSQNLEMINKLP
ncbi:hypothetical protein BDW75DRAFT_243334 [Aspergillus navahoensis]